VMRCHVDKLSWINFQNTSNSFSPFPLFLPAWFSTLPD